MIEPGIYEHFKGDQYEVFGTVKHSETKEMMVLYKPIETDQAWVRPMDMFKGNVTVDGIIQPRFRLLDL